MNEAEARAELIDPALRAAGWGVVEGSRIQREYPITHGRIQGAGKRGKAEIADYVLVYRNTKLAVIEGLGHEAGLHPVAMRHVLDQALVAHRLVHRCQHRAVFQSDFHLAGAYSEIAVHAGMPCALQAA